MTQAHRPALVGPNDNPGWLGREPTGDEQDVAEWLLGRPELRNILHVGVGTAFLSRRFGSRVTQGLTKDGGEARHATGLGLDAIVCNKYDVESYSALLNAPFDCIVDVNIRSYACCDQHFSEYMTAMLDSLTSSGILVTHRSGLDYLVPTSIDNLKVLAPDWTVHARRKVVVMRPRAGLRIRKWWAAFSRSRVAE